MGDRFLYAGPFGEESASGYRGNRGPALEAAMRAAIEASERHGRAELWVFHSSRLGRGSGRKNEARSVLEVFTYLRRHDVTLRSVEDDPYVTDEAFVGMASKMATKYGDDLSAHTKRGLQARRKSGKPLGRIPYGYRLETTIGADGRVTTVAVIDEARRAVIERIFNEIERGFTPGQVATRLNDDRSSHPQQEPSVRTLGPQRCSATRHAGRLSRCQRISGDRHP